VVASAASRAGLAAFRLALNSDAGLTARVWSAHEASSVPLVRLAELGADLALMVTTVREGQMEVEPNARVASARADHKTRPLALIIDDDEWIRSLIAEALNEDGFDVEQASDGVEGLALAQQCLPDIVLLDLSLPRRSGVEVLRALKEEHPTREIPVLIISAYALVGLSRELDDADGVVHKPFDLDKLLDRVRRLLPARLASTAGLRP
jgi:CheY-like chemotaxis protein